MRKMRLRKLVSAVLAAVMLFTIAVTVSATEDAGCGGQGQIILLRVDNQSGLCAGLGGPPDCVSTVTREVYGCSNGCGITGYAIVCRHGRHLIGQIQGKVIGFCNIP